MMQDLADLADQYPCRAQEMRTLAAGIFDDAERGSFMQFIHDYERLAREVKGRDLRVAMPRRTDSSNR